MSIRAAIFRSLKRVVCFLSASPLCIRFKCIICGGQNLWFRALIRFLSAFACNLPPGDSSLVVFRRQGVPPVDGFSDAFLKLITCMLAAASSVVLLF